MVRIYEFKMMPTAVKVGEISRITSSLRGKIKNQRFQTTKLRAKFVDKMIVLIAGKVYIITSNHMYPQ